MPENSTHKCTNAVNNVQPIRNSSHMAKILSVYNRLQAGHYENGNGGKSRVSRLTHAVYPRNAFIAETEIAVFANKLSLA